MSLVNLAYWGREQTLIKHEMLRKYLGPAARIIGTVYDSFTYVDCCSGPWNTARDDLSDTSFRIAIKELQAARTYLSERNRSVEFRCLFVEKESDAYSRLEQFCNSVSDLEVKPIKADFTDKVDDILEFIAERRNCFSFFFIDPTGWSPLAIRAIAPLLEHRPSEVLINFMTSHIRRFLESANVETTFGPDYMQKVIGSTGQDRDDRAAYSFADEIRRFYPYVCTSVVLHPYRKQTHFHLVYGTRHPKGREKFKEAEKSCFGLMEEVRLETQYRDDSQGILFEHRPVEDPFVQSLRQHYLQDALEVVEQRVREQEINEDDAWEIASRFPLVWRSDVSRWFKARGARVAGNSVRNVSRRATG